MSLPGNSIKGENKMNRPFFYIAIGALNIPFLIYDPSFWINGISLGFALGLALSVYCDNK